MTDPFVPDVTPDLSFMDREYTDSAKEWGRRRAAETRHNDISRETKLNYETIIFPDTAGCRHAALVVCAYARDAADARLLLEALALPTIIREGGDGRRVRVQRTVLALKREDPKPLGYDPNDYGRPEERRKRGRRD